MLRRILDRRILTTTAVAVAASIASVTGVSLAQENNAAPTVSVPSVAPATPGGVLAQVHLVLAGLVTDGTIDQQQADAVQTEANAGSIDPKQLVQNGTLTDTQMRAVADQLDQIKRSNGG